MTHAITTSHQLRALPSGAIIEDRDGLLIKRGNDWHEFGNDTPQELVSVPAIIVRAEAA